MGGTTGVSLEQGLGLTDVPRGCPGRRPGDERGYALLPWCGWCRQSTTAPPLCPQYCGPFTAAQVALDQIDLPTSCPFLPLSLPLSR